MDTNRNSAEDELAEKRKKIREGDARRQRELYARIMADPIRAAKRREKKRLEARARRARLKQQLDAAATEKAESCEQVHRDICGNWRSPLGSAVDLFCDYVAKWSLSPLTLEAEEKSQNMVDHTFVHSDLVINVNYSAIDPPVDTDHLYLLQLVVKIPVENNAFRGLPSQASIPRYYLKYLEDAPTLRLFQSTYSHLTRTLTQPLANLATFFTNSQPEEAQESRFSAPTVLKSAGKIPTIYLSI
ncbi:uncharacterized protein VTP21DRAFT_9650 [Calcarisporiella thermophila]|uniref:uncharacterized protein n=1 Tax=Calcarisporiella thermophila TaxID=911321 RepID=UPI00374341B3